MVGAGVPASAGNKDPRFSLVPPARILPTLLAMNPQSPWPVPPPCWYPEAAAGWLHGGRPRAPRAGLSGRHTRGIGSDSLRKSCVTRHRVRCLLCFMAELKLPRTNPTMRALLPASTGSGPVSWA